MNTMIKLERIVHLFGICLLVLLFLIGAIVGACLNSMVVVANGGKMPVYSEIREGETRTHFYYKNSSEIVSPELTDIFKFGKVIYSLGDFIIYFSLGMILIFIINLFYLMIKWKIKDKNYIKRFFVQKYGV